ncbi:hypothetical protein TWF106_002940 [Orbilia oligospora]|uniref:Clr5 domain-containing protein n=1 Tax=Orbilia oligospora TaxID=2813651 RepID=A0A7C8PZ66_ORBOL|nr:hypothetical protein TWF788_005190 [Orbilia oligospora]KAF3225059.1 hypothetical protein TWF106_002940 [Orbilia oligospora]
MASQQLQQLNKTRVAKISQETWESYKSDISRLYLDERKTLDQVRLVMEESLGFIATKAQYIRMVNEVWRLKKNIKGSDFDCIDTRERKRARDGKKTGVKLGNRQLDESELRRKRSRHHVSVIEQHQRRVAAQPGEKNIETATPEGMEIFTPTPSIPSPQNTDLVVSGIQDHLFLNSTVSLSKYSPSPALQSASFSLPSSPSNRSMIIASSSSSELPYISFEDPANEGESSDAILLPREFSPDAAQLRVIISSQVREYLHPVALYNNLFHTTPGVGFSLLFENYLKEIFEGSYESLDRASKKYPAIREVLSHEPITDVGKWLSEIQFNLLESSQPKIEVIYFLKAYMIRVSNNIDGGSTRRMIMDQSLRSGGIKKHIKTIEMILREAHLR